MALPIPVATNDPGGNMPAEEIEQLACNIMNARLYNGAAINDVMGGVTARLGEFNYYYYLQDLLDYCILVSSI